MQTEITHYNKNIIFIAVKSPIVWLTEYLYYIAINNEEDNLPTNWG